MKRIKNTIKSSIERIAPQELVVSGSPRARKVGGAAKKSNSAHTFYSILLLYAIRILCFLRILFYDFMKSKLYFFYLDTHFIIFLFPG